MRRFIIKNINGKINYSEDKILLSDVIGNFGDFDLMSRKVFMRLSNVKLHLRQISEFKEGKLQ